MGPKWQGQNLGARPHVGTRSGAPAVIPTQNPWALWALPIGGRVPSASLLSLPCSLHHPWPSFPAVCRRLVFPHHPHHGVLCISALSKDPEAQFCVSLLQLPHRCGAGRKTMGRAWEGVQRWVGGVRRRGVVSVMSGERILRPLLLASL